MPALSPVIAWFVAVVWLAGALRAPANPAQAVVDSTAPPAERLRQLLDLYWKYSMEEAPEMATYAGYPGQNHRWSDLSDSAIQRRKHDLGHWLAAVDSIDRAALAPSDQLNFDLFRRGVRLDLEASGFPGELMPVNQMGGVQQEIAQTIALMPKTTLDHYHDLVSRLRKAPALIDQTIALLRRGAAQGITPPRITLRDVPQQIRNQMAADLPGNPAFGAFTNFPAGFSEGDRARLAGEAATAIREHLIPAYRRLLAYFEEDYLPKTREAIAASSLPNGEAWYAFSARRYTTTGLTPQQIHQTGLAEVARIRAEMDSVIKKSGFTGSFAEFVHFLRTDPRFFYTRPEDLITGYREISKRADPELAKLFGKLPRLPYGVLPIPSYAEKSQTTAYYQPGAGSFGRAGYFFANTYDLRARPKWEMEALTLHEAMPGHHLQIALSQEMENVPEFRKHGGYTAFVEGWGLYAESLGEAMGFYQDPYSKFGQLTYEMWRAIRLVLDTGLHALGWTRQQAIDYFKANAAKTEHDIGVEVDRYIAWPGQALAYKIGELKIKELRRKAEAQLGARFDLRAFHDHLLAEGALPLDLLEERMNRWMSQ